MPIYKVLMTQRKVVSVEANSEAEAEDLIWDQNYHVIDAIIVRECNPSSPYYSPLNSPTIEIKFAPFNQPEWETYVVRPHKAGWVSARQQDILLSEYWDYTPVGKPVVECCEGEDRLRICQFENYIVFPSTDRRTPHILVSDLKE